MREIQLLSVSRELENGKEDVTLGSVIKEVVITFEVDNSQNNHINLYQAMCFACDNDLYLQFYKVKLQETLLVRFAGNKDGLEKVYEYYCKELDRKRKSYNSREMYYS